MYSIILKNGKIINIEADDMVYDEKVKLVKFYNRRFYDSVSLIAEINMDNVAGWVRTSCITNEE